MVWFKQQPTDPTPSACTLQLAFILGLVAIVKRAGLVKGYIEQSHMPQHVPGGLLISTVNLQDKIVPRVITIQSCKLLSASIINRRINLLSH